MASGCKMVAKPNVNGPPLLGSTRASLASLLRDAGPWQLPQLPRVAFMLEKKKKKLCLPQSPALLQNMSTLEPITLVSGCKMAVTPCLNDQYCSVLLHPHYFLESTSNNHNRPVHLHINRMLHSTELEIRNIRVYQTRVIFLKFLFNLISEEMVLTILECYSAMPFRALPV